MEQILVLKINRGIRFLVCKFYMLGIIRDHKNHDKEKKVEKKGALIEIRS